MFLDIGSCNKLLDMMPKAQTEQSKTDKWEYIKLKNSKKQMIQQTAKCFREQEKLYAKNMQYDVHL